MPSRIKIGFASTDWSRSVLDAHGNPASGGANWVRLQQNRPHLPYVTVTGLLVHHPGKGFGILDWAGTSHYDCKVVVLQRLMFGNLVEKIQNRPSNGPILINDIDDWYWGLHSDNNAYKLTHPNFNAEENIDHYKKIIQACDGVTVSTPFLFDKITNDFGCSKVNIIENGVTVTDFNPRYHKQRKIKVGWVGSTSHRSGDLEILHDVLDSPKWKLHHSGHNTNAPYFADKVGVRRDKVSLSPMYHPQQYARNAFCFDVGIAPLNDVPFNHAKSWIKAIEYAASGVPFIMSDIGEYRRLKEKYGFGRLASTKDEWVEHLMELTDFSIRIKEARENLELVKQLDVKNMAKNWSDVIESYL